MAVPVGLAETNERSVSLCIDAFHDPISGPVVTLDTILELPPGSRIGSLTLLPTQADRAAHLLRAAARKAERMPL